MENYAYFDEDVFQVVAEGIPDYAQHNQEMNLAWQFIAHTSVSVFLTGVAGTGKTTFLKKLRELSPKRMAVLAPTGVAAINAGGQTIHSFFQLPFGPFIPGKNSRSNAFKMTQRKKDLIRTLDLLVIDEISMVRADLLDEVDDALRKYRNPAKPFGGVQLLMIGDLMQLAPVSKDSEWRTIEHMYATPYFFSSRALQSIKYVTIELKHIYRQQDSRFIDLLNHVRTGNMTTEVVDALNKRYIPNFSTENTDYIRLTTHNATANEYNEMRLNALSGESWRFRAQVKGDFPENNYPNELELVLKPDAQVMFMKNDTSGANLYYNGKIGTVVRYNPETKAVVVRCRDNGAEIALLPAEWQNVKYAIDETTKEIKEEVAGTFLQYPLRLAWAITVHKSQGLTFDHAVLDINRSFTHGQVYVALSRCRTLEGLVLSSRLAPYSVITDNSVNSFIQKEQASIGQSIEQLPSYRCEYAISLLDELYSMTGISHGLSRLTRVLDEHLYVQQAQLLASMKALMPVVDEKLVSVAYRFAPAYRQAMAESSGRVEGTPLEARIKSSAEYFNTQLEHLYYVGLKGTAINIENKAVAEKYKNALVNLRNEITTKLYIFKALEKETYSIQKYLSLKAKALLEITMPQSQPTPKAKPARAKQPEKGLSEGQKREYLEKFRESMRNEQIEWDLKMDQLLIEIERRKIHAEYGLDTPKPKKKKAKEPKQEKVPTKELTFQLYEQGLNIEEIASKRGLKEDTISNHLAQLSADGRIDINKLISPARQQRIREIAASFDTVYTLTNIKEKLPDDYKFYEIRLVLNYDQNKQ